MKQFLFEAQNGNLPESMLVNVNNPDGSKSVAKLNITAAKDFNKMVADAMKEGIKIKLSGPSSGYRKLGSPEEGCKKGFTQWCAWQKWKAGKGNLAAEPGESNHGWGSAVDVANCESGGKVHNWLVTNAKKYGFTPFAKESWHWDHKGSIGSLDYGGSTPAEDENPELEKLSVNLRDIFKDEGIDIKSSDNISSSFENLGPLAMFIPLLKNLGFGSPSEILKSIKSGDIDKDDLQKIVKKETGDDFYLPDNVKTSIEDMEKKYRITITKDHIDNEFKQEGRTVDDKSGENSKAKKQINLLVRDAKNKFKKELSGKDIVSGYRSYKDQVDNFGKKAASRGVDDTQKSNALPGFSQHHSGKAFDIFSVDTGWWNSNINVKNWVADNAEKYGFKVTYQKQNLRIPEPWHLYYIGGESITESVVNNVKLENQITKMKKIIYG